MLGFSGGRYWCGRSVPEGPGACGRHRARARVLTRCGAVLPAVAAAAAGGRLDVAAWILAGGAGWLAGRETARANSAAAATLAPDRWSPSRQARWTGAAALRFTAWPRVKGSRWTAPAVICALGDSVRGDVRPAVGDAVWLGGKGRPPGLWERRTAVLEGWAPQPASVPGGFDPAVFMAGRGLRWRGKVIRSGRSPPGGRDALQFLGATALAGLRGRIAAALADGYPRRESLLLKSVLLGDRDPGLAPQKESFARLGLAHLFAVSGLHVGILAAVVLVLLRPFARGPAARLGAPLLLLPAYVLLTGAAGSTLRAAGLTVLVLAGPVAGRRGDSLRSLGLLFWLSVFWQPAVVVDTGFRLSYLAACGIVATQRLIGRNLRRLAGPLRWAASGLAVSCGAQWFTLPEVAASFGWIHPFSPLVNLVCVPVFGMAVWLAVPALAIGAVPGIGGLGGWLSAWAWLLLRLLEGGACWCCRHLAPPTGLTVWGPLRTTLFLLLSAAALAGLHRVRLQRRGGAAIAAVCLAATLCLLPTGRWIARGGMRVVQFAVGQGDCAVFVFPDGKAVVLDTGDRWRSGGTPWKMSVAPWLVRQGIEGFAAVVLTHGHSDHTGGAADLAADFDVGRWLLGGRAEAPRPPVSEAPTAPLRRGGLVHRAGIWSLECVYPAAGHAPSDNENDNSIVLALRRSGRTVGFWAGDLELEGEAELPPEALDCGPGGVQVLKAGHHGSSTSSSQSLLDRLRPRLALVCCGVENRHGHPSHGPFLARGDTLDVLRTDLDGTVLLEWDRDGALRARAMRMPEPFPAAGITVPGGPS